MNHSFIWADLSTFDMKSAKRFYHDCLGWQFEDIGDGYLVCNANQHASAGLYLMPEKFQQIGMPSFWMSYIQVENIDETVRVAEQQGAKIEVQPESAPGGGRIALIRDPAGAGFTCYEGDDLGGRNDSTTKGRMVWNELHVSDISKVKNFYATLFQWDIRSTSQANRYEIYSSGQLIAGIQVTRNELKGDKEYWGVYFSVDNLQATQASIKSAGGQVVTEQPIGEQPALLVYDSQGAAFYIVETASLPNTVTDKKSFMVKWRAMLGLLLVALAIVLEANWIWGVFFLLWVIPDLKTGSTHFFEHVERRHNPVIYWLIVATWVTLSIYLLFGSLVAL